MYIFVVSQAYNTQKLLYAMIRTYNIIIINIQYKPINRRLKQLFKILQFFSLF